MLRHVAALSLALLFSPLVLGAAGQGSKGDSGAVIKDGEYHYGMNLDIQKVVSISPKPDICDVVPADMVYLDSQGQRHQLSYRVMGNCIGG